MDNKNFVALVKYARERQDRVLGVKGADYADNNDRLSNFKQVAALLGVDSTTVAGVYFLKHVTAICRAIRDKTLSSEPLEGRFDDAVNYLYLLEACFDEQDDKKQEEAFNTIPPIPLGPPSTSSARSVPIPYELLREQEEGWPRKSVSW